MGRCYEMETVSLNVNRERNSRVSMLHGLSTWMFASLLPPPNNHNEGEKEFYELEANLNYF